MSEKMPSKVYQDLRIPSSSPSLHVPEDAGEGLPQVPHGVVLVPAGGASRHGRVHGGSVGLVGGAPGGRGVVGVGVSVGHALGHGVLLPAGAGSGSVRAGGGGSGGDVHGEGAAWHDGSLAAHGRVVVGRAPCPGPCGVPAISQSVSPPVS